MAKNEQAPQQAQHRERAEIQQCVDEGTELRGWKTQALIKDIKQATSLILDAAGRHSACKRWFRWNSARLLPAISLAKTTAVESEKRDDLV
jgi:hypothetical protein